MDLIGILFPHHFPRQFFFVFFFPPKYKEAEVDGSSFVQEERGAYPRRNQRPRWPLRRLRSPPPPVLCLAPALPGTWSPVKFRAAPGNTCRQAGAPQTPSNHGNGGQWESRSACWGEAKRGLSRRGGAGPRCQKTEGGAQIPRRSLGGPQCTGCSLGP